MKERIEFQQTQLLKSQRDREGMQTELEVIKDRWDKAHTQLQKLQVIYIKDINIYILLIYPKYFFCIIVGKR